MSIYYTLPDILEVAKSIEFRNSIQNENVSNSNFLDYLELHLDIILKQIWKETRYFEGDFGEDIHSIKPSVISDKKLTASITLKGQSQANIKISTGTFLAMLDAITRAHSSALFLNDRQALIEKKGEYWHGCETLDIQKEEVGDFLPLCRYVNYEYLGNIEPVSPFCIGTYFSKIPIDEWRCQSITIMSHLATAWIVLHEESHYRLGHLHFINDILGNQQETELFLSEHSSPAISGLDSSDYRIFEWQADRSATQDFFDCYYTAGFIQLVLPDFPVFDQEGENKKSPIDNKKLWHIRYLVASIGIAMVVLDRVSKVNRISSNYPSIPVRFCTAINAVFNRAIKSFSIDKATNNVVSDASEYKMSLEDIVDIAAVISYGIHDADIFLDLMIAEEKLENENRVFGEDIGANVFAIVFICDTLIRKAKNAEQKEYYEKVYDEIIRAFKLFHSPSVIDKNIKDAQEISQEYGLYANEDDTGYWNKLKKYREFATPSK